MRGEKEDKRRNAHDLRMQLKALQFRLRELVTTDGSDSDESILVNSWRAAVENQNNF